MLGDLDWEQTPWVLSVINLNKATIRKPLSNYKNIKLNQMTSLHSLRVSVFFGNKILQGMNAKELISQETTTNSSRGLGLGFVMSHDPSGKPYSSNPSNFVGNKYMESCLGL